MKIRVSLLLCAAALTASGGCGGPDERALPPRVRIGQHTWNVEIADNDATRSRGMGGRKEVPPGMGMLFVFPREEPVRFHMLDCYIPLDVAFIDAGGRIVEIRTMYVEADPADPKTHYPSRAPVTYALEVAADTFARLGIERGDAVELLGGARDAAKAAR